MGTLSVIVPVYNEERTLAEVMRTLIAALPDAQIVYVDDGSRDGSLSILREHARAQDSVLTKANGGKGSAIRFGLEHVTGEYTVIQDADLEYEPAQILTLLAEARAHPGAAVFGSRFLQKNPNLYRRFLLGNKAVTLALNILFGSKLTDSYTCFKLLPTELFRSLDIRSNGFEMEAEICAKCLRRKIPIREIAVNYHPRSIKEGKKIRFSDAWKGVRKMLEIRLGAR